MNIYDVLYFVPLVICMLFTISVPFVLKDTELRGGPVTSLEIIIMWALTIMPIFNLVFLGVIIAAAIATYNERKAKKNTK